MTWTILWLFVSLGRCKDVFDKMIHSGTGYMIWYKVSFVLIPNTLRLTFNLDVGGYQCCKRFDFQLGSIKFIKNFSQFTVHFFSKHFFHTNNCLSFLKKIYKKLFLITCSLMRRLTWLRLLWNSLGPQFLWSVLFKSDQV